MPKRLKYGKGIKVKWAGEIGEIVARDRVRGKRMYKVRLGPSHFIYLSRQDFALVDSIIKYDTLVKLRETWFG